MSAGRPEGDRDVIPRWRNPRDQISSAELAPIRKVDRKFEQTGLKERERDWLRERTLPFALDLLGTGLVLGSSLAVEEAASQVTEDDGAPALAKTAAERLLGRAGVGQELPLSEATSREVYVEISRLKQRVRRDPRNALAWTELARQYTILGQREKAMDAMRVAIGIAPHHRHVVRAAVRLTVHHGEFDRAHRIVLSTPRTLEDPWLLATELAAAAAATKRPRLTRLAQRMLEDKSHEPRATSELASALGTLEFRAGSERQARRLIEGSLIRPNENAIAQGQWLSKHLRSLEIADELLEDSAEARAIRYGAAMESESALAAAWQWHIDQPFASGPGELGSYHASLAGRFEEGAHIARVTLKANPKEFLLNNNLTFCLLKLNDLDGAAKALKAVSRETLSDAQRSTFMATMGLFEFRRGNSDQGRRFYEESISGSRDHTHRMLAKVNLAMEEYRAGFYANALKLIRELMARAGHSDPEVEAWLKRLPSEDAIPAR